MAATPETHDRTETQLPAHWTTEWPTLERDHDPRPLTSNDPRETTQTTLDRFGLECPPAPDREPRWRDTRDRTVQQSLFEAPSPWWHNPSVMDALYNDRDLSFETIATDVFDGEICTETARRWTVEKHDLKASEATLAEKLAAEDFGPEDAGLSATTDDDHAKYTKRGRSA